ncbi:MAG: restriction endonuclease [Acidobacteriota bacterium]|nr:restriction endonuclease [Acidobacteriota bacterium]
MAVPDFQTIMLPFLQMAEDGKEHSIPEMLSSLAMHFGLSEKDLAERIPSGRQTKFYNRVTWAATYLKKAAIIEYTKRGVFRITERGLNLIGQNLSRIDMKTLNQFPEYIAFKTVNKKKINRLVIDEPIGIEKTPDELLGESYLAIRRSLATEILDTVKSCTPLFFEKLVVDLLVKMGYGGTMEDAGQAIGRSGDGGIDGIIKEDRLGLDVIYLQAKRWENTVGSPEIQKFAGALQGRRATKGVFITTSDYSKGAIDFVGSISNKIILIDGNELADLMIDYNVGASVDRSYEIKKIDSDYFIEE